MPISDLHGLMSLQVGLFMKSDLWSFSIMNEYLGAEASMRSASSSFSAIILSFKVIMSGTFYLGAGCSSLNTRSPSLGNSSLTALNCRAIK